VSGWYRCSAGVDAQLRTSAKKKTTTPKALVFSSNKKREQNKPLLAQGRRQNVTYSKSLFSYFRIFR
jgi:hypothetical protein